MKKSKNAEGIPALLTRTEYGWLNNKIELSRGYQRKIKYDIRRKIKIFNELELPLLIKSGFISNTTNCNAVTTNPHMNSPRIIQNNEIPAQKRSLGRDLDPGPLPYQGNALPG